MVLHTGISELKGKLKNAQRARIFLIIIGIILAIAAIVLIASYVRIKNKTISEKDLCKSDLCIRSAAALRLAMNTSVNPCDDFYQFSCGHWTEEHPDYGWSLSPVAADSLMQEKITAATIKFLQSNKSKTEPLPVKQSRDLYASCMNQAAADKLGYAPIFKYLSLLGLPAIPAFTNLSDIKQAKGHRIDWFRTEALLTRILGIQSFLGFYVDYNETNTSQHYMVMGLPSESLMFEYYPLPSSIKSAKHKYYKSVRHSKEDNEDEEDAALKKEETRKDVYFYISTIISANYSEYSDLPDNFNEIINNTTYTIMRLLDEVEVLYSLRRPPENITDTEECSDRPEITVTELQEKTNKVLQAFNLTPREIWKPYLQQMFDGLNVTLDFNKTQSLYVCDNYTVLYLVTVATYLSKLPDELVELWFWWKIVSELITSTTTEIKKYVEDLTDTTTFDLPKILQCVGITKDYMGMAISYAIADNIVLNDTRQKVEDMILDIKVAFEERVKRIKWMSKKIKAETLDKSKAIISLVGYPDWLMEDGALEKYYLNVTIHPDTYLENIISLMQRRVKIDLQELYLGHHIHDWPLDDSDDVVPMAYLFYPLYNLGLEVLNYAATGSTLGHELIHGFDNSGRKYDKHGNLRQWWDQKSIDKFEEKAQCFLKQYNKFYVPELGFYVNGKTTLGENIADNDGLRLSYIAYKNYRKRNKDDLKLPGFEQYSQDQMFFIAYGSIWCDDVKADNMLYDDEEPHCPKIYRLLGSLENSKEFARAFHCPKGSKMNPAEPKCNIW